MSASNKPLGNETVTFIQNQLPGLTDGVYQLTVAQHVNDAKGNPISGDGLKNQYTFAVKGDRFSLTDPKLVDSVFPAANGTGEFSTVLPHVVFTKTTFPWTREVNTPQGELGAEPDVATWLAVLVFDEDDPVTLPPAARRIGDLFPPELYADSTLGENYSYFYLAKTTALDPGETLEDAVQTIDVPLEFFWTVAPAAGDLQLLAHVREVSLVTKATLAGTVGPGTPVGTYSIVFGNRLPQTGKKSYAYLVSLEHLAAFLPEDSGGPPEGNGFDGKKFLRLAVLSSWTFYSTGESAEFVDQLLRLNGRPEPASQDQWKNVPDAANTNLRLTYTGGNGLIGNAVQMGYAPLNTELRTGEKTVSWYRGPLTPYLVAPGRITVPVSSADQANGYDPTTGLFEESYGAAWTLGRLLALQDTGFSTALYSWKTGLSQQVVDAIEQELLQAQFGAVLDAGPAPAALAGDAKARPSRALLHKTVQALGGKE